MDVVKLLKYPFIRKWTFKIRKQFLVHVYDQPGRWMSNVDIGALHGEIVRIASYSMEDIPTYGVFTGQRTSFANRVVGVVYDRDIDMPVAFTALVYLPVAFGGKTFPVLHLGITMITKPFRGQRIQGPLFEKMFFLPSMNQVRNNWILTNIAASPAGIGSVADYFKDAYPHYRGETQRQPFHLEVAKQLLDGHRHEFGCSREAEFNPDTFVVSGSNREAGGGAYQFIAHDPVSRYKNEACNAFCQDRLDFDNGDELFQVARLNMLQGVTEIIGRIGTRKKEAKR